MSCTMYMAKLRRLSALAVSLKKLMQQGICNSEFYGDLVYKFKKIIEIQSSLIFSNVL